MNSDVFNHLRAVALGQVTHDRYGEDIVPGGCAFYGARAFHSLGAQTGLFTSVGEDFRCQESLESLDVHMETGGLTTVFSNLYPPGKARVQIIECSAPAMSPKRYPDDLGAPDLLFIAPVMGELQEPGWAKASGAKYVSAGIQGFVKEAGVKFEHGRLIQAREGGLLPSLMDGVDAAFLSEEDVVLVGQADFLEELIQLVPIVAVTNGERGCRVFAEGESFQVGVFPVECVDPTGAGDTFAAGMSLGLAAGWTPRDAARMGAAAASVIVQGRGGERLDHLGEAFARFPYIS